MKQQLRIIKLSHERRLGKPAKLTLGNADDDCDGRYTTVGQAKRLTEQINMRILQAPVW